MKTYQYHCDATAIRLGLMRCSMCGKNIETGMFRSRDAGDYYVTHHMHCTSTDPHWSDMENLLQQQRVEHENSRNACIDFIQMTGITDLTDYLSIDQIVQIAGSKITKGRTQ